MKYTVLDTEVRPERFIGRLELDSNVVRGVESIRVAIPNEFNCCIPSTSGVLDGLPSSVTLNIAMVEGEMEAGKLTPILLINLSLITKAQRNGFLKLLDRRDT